MHRAVPPFPQYAFMAWCLVKKGSLLFSKQPITCLCPEPDESSPPPHIVCCILWWWAKHRDGWSPCCHPTWYPIQRFFFFLFFIKYEGVSKSFQTELITKYMLTTITTHWEVIQRVMVAKLTRLTHKIAIQLHLVAESCTICSTHSRQSGQKLLDIPSYVFL
jgi:hypothetical protein